MAPIALIVIFWIQYPDNAANIIAFSLVLCGFAWEAMNRMRWSFVIGETGFEWGGFLRTVRPYSDIKSMYIDNETRKPVLVFERKGTIRKDAFGSLQVENFGEFSRVAMEAWQARKAD